MSILDVLSVFEQSEEAKLDGVAGLVQALPEYLQAAAAAASASRGNKKDTPFSMPVKYHYCSYTT